MATLESQLAGDATFLARWQTAVTQFESGANTKWDDNPCVDPYALAFGAMLAYVRTNGDQGLTWGLTRAEYIDRVLTGIYHPAIVKTGSTAASTHTVGIALVYDFLYNDLTSTQRSDMEGWITLGYNASSYLSGRNHWDGNNNHVQKVFAALALGGDKIAEAYSETIIAIESQEWMGYAIGVGYTWTDSEPMFIGLCGCLYAIKNAGGYSDAQTWDRMLTFLRDAPILIRQFVIPHPSLAVDSDKLYNDRYNQEGPTEFKSIRLQVGAHLLWALAILPGKVNISSASSYSNQSTLANSESDYLGYVADELKRLFPGTSRSHYDVKNMNGLNSFGPEPTIGGWAAFFSVPVWLIMNLNDRAAIAPGTAGIPKVRRWWPGTLDWTTIRSDLGSTRDTTGSLMTYVHKRYYHNSYDGNCFQNGSWHLHRAGPLLGQRGSDSHAPLSRKATWAANGTVTFVDSTEWPQFQAVNKDLHDEGGIRGAGGTRVGKTQILADPLCDFGPITNWYADTQVVAITSNLLRSYNSNNAGGTTEVQYGTEATNQKKISHFTREFVAIQRNGDGTDHERIFTYDRITLTDTKFQPRYNLNPLPPTATIDGTETEVLGIGAGTSDAAKLDLAGPWEATGPIKWTYSNATCLTVDTVTEPSDAVPGSGKARVTWLRPSGAGVIVTKRGSNNINQINASGAGSYDNQPALGEFDGWHGVDGVWDDNLGRRAYAGTFTVVVSPVTVTLDTRFLVVADGMAASDTPDTAAELTCDANSVAARCGATAVVFSKETGTRSTGSVTIPSGVTFVVIVNLPASQVTTLGVTGTLFVTSSNPVTASSTGVAKVTVTGAGDLTWQP